ncbi:hypothetical protein [Sphingobacterium thalpophilum]|uniref:hypothetical protein n=1 Tax=Sphingobacterium thalpophilum TaxID=259 RepID=UPI0024A651F5|nr:hypothetical protein [Sphingobacterium thalpophilum]
MANQYLIKETIDAMRNLSASEIAGLQGSSPTYAGVQLLGYYEKGDTPAPLIYYPAPTTPDPGPEDGGSVISVGQIKLQAVFQSGVDCMSLLDCDFFSKFSYTLIVQPGDWSDLPSEKRHIQLYEFSFEKYGMIGVVAVVFLC